MKKKIRLSFIIILMLQYFLFAQNLGDKIYKEVLLGDEVVYKWLQYTNYYENNSNGKRLYAKSYLADKEKTEWSEYDEESYEYDEKGNLIHEKKEIFLDQKYVEESFYEYNSDNKLIYKIIPSQTGTNTKICYKYDSNGNEIYTKSTAGNFEKFSDYDSNNNLIHTKMFGWKEHFEEEWYEYNLNSNLIHYKKISNHGLLLEEWYEYDNNGILIHKKNSHDNEEWYEYDSEGKRIRVKKNDSEIFYEYDEKGRLLHQKPIPDSAGKELFYNYDSKGNIIYYKSVFLKSIYDENWREYEYLPDGKVIIRLFRVF